MVKVRQDAWSHEDDLLLAETVLRHIREGSTQLKAFDEVGDQLNRTSAACGFRWNAEIRQKYISAIDMAKRQRKEKKRALAQMEKQAVPSISSLPSPTMHYEDDFIIESAQEFAVEEHFEANNEKNLDLDQVIAFLQDFKLQGRQSEKTVQQIDTLQRENKQLEDQITNLEQELSETRTHLQTIQSDYKTFIRIMDRARQMNVLEEDAAQPSFRMDQHGKLQQVVENSI